MSKLLAKRGSNSNVRRSSNTYDSQQKAKLVELGQSNKSYREIVKYLSSEIRKSTEIISFNYSIECFLEDGVYQLNKAVEALYGASENKGREKPSGGQENVQMLNVDLADGTSVKVPYGKIQLPDMGEGAHIAINYNSNTNVLNVSGSCEFQYQSLMDDIIALTRTLLNTDSIYKSQAFELTRDNFSPKYLNLSNIDREFMVLPEKTLRELKPLTARILEPEKCVDRGIPLKYGALFEGAYGFVKIC